MNFALILFLVTLATGILWLIDVLYASKLRAPGSKNPIWVEWGASLFPVILAVFALRSFVVEPFKIPSGSMIPTLQVGDYILVNKFTYGLRLPVVGTQVVSGKAVARGDVVVFRYPPEPSVDYIKRVIGLPGDTVSYQNKQLSINGVPVPRTAEADYLHTDRLYSSRMFRESLGDVSYNTLNDADAPAFVPDVVRFPHREQCRYDSAGFVCKVPEGNYFVMGDNRDNSKDSRVWGFVPDANVVGKAFFIWFHWGDFGRIGSFR